MGTYELLSTERTRRRDMEEDVTGVPGRVVDGGKSILWLGPRPGRVRLGNLMSSDSEGCTTDPWVVNFSISTLIRSYAVPGRSLNIDRHKTHQTVPRRLRRRQDHPYEGNSDTTTIPPTPPNRTSCTQCILEISTTSSPVTGFYFYLSK